MPQNQPAKRGQLEEQKQWVPPAEIPVSGLMMEKTHPQRAAQRPAQNDGKKQRAFRNSPLTLPRPALVHPMRKNAAKFTASRYRPRRQYHSVGIQTHLYFIS